MPEKLSLNKHPEIAQEIGFLIMLTANLEGWMETALIELFRGKREIAEAVFSRVESISDKFEILLGVAKARNISPLADAIISSAGEIRSAIEFRNAVAHGAFVFNDKGKIGLVTAYLTKKRGEPKERGITPKSIRTHSEAVGRLLDKISELCDPSSFFLRPPKDKV
nr:hypothetical protein [Brucella anthropi]